MSVLTHRENFFSDIHANPRLVIPVLDYYTSTLVFLGIYFACFNEFGMLKIPLFNMCLIFGKTKVEV